MRSSSAGLARPVRTEANSCVRRLHALAHALAGVGEEFVGDLAHGSLTQRRGDERPHPLAAHYPVDVALVVHVEDVERQPVLHAERERRGVHDVQPALQCVHVGDLVDELALGVRPRVGGVDALDPVLGHEDGLGVDLDRAQRGRGVRREERVAGARGEDDDRGPSRGGASPGGGCRARPARPP